MNKNFFNPETESEVIRSLVVGDLPFTDTLVTQAPNWTKSEAAGCTITETGTGIQIYSNNYTNIGANGSITSNGIAGNFDIQVDFTYVRNSQQSPWRHKSGLHLYLYDSGGFAGGLYMWFSQRSDTGIEIIGYQGNNPTWTILPEGTISTGFNQGDSRFRNNKLRITYNNTTNVFTFYVWNGSSWVGGNTLIPSWTSLITSVVPRCINEPQWAEGTANFSNFKINSADTVSGSWKITAPNDFYGKKFYDKFAGTGPESPTENWWNNGSFNTQIVNNAVLFDSTDTEAKTLTGLFHLKGDFDVQWDYDQSGEAYNATDEFYMNWKFRTDVATEEKVWTYSNDSNAPVLVWDKSIGGQEIQNSIPTSGKLKVIRVGSLWTIQYYDGVWTNLATDITGVTDNVYLHMYENSSTGVVSDCKMSNFIVNTADKMIWPGGTLKYWNGSTWVPTYMNRWNGSTWEDSILKRYTGSSFGYVGNME